MAITSFIPTVWSETLCKSLDKQYVAIANCTREFEGEIKEKGSKVTLCKLNDVRIGNYTKGNDITGPDELDGTTIDLVIDRAKYFNFQIDDVDKAQATPKLMEEAMRVAASGLANLADQCVFEQHVYAKHNILSQKGTVENILDLIIQARTKLYENNVIPGTEVVLEVSPQIAELIFKAKLNLSTDNGENLETGCIGSIAGFKVFVSNNIVKTMDANSNTCHNCYARTKRSIAFAEQISEVEAYRPENRFADAVKGLHLYGAKLIYPDELVRLQISLGDNPTVDD
ncbi:MAG: P22 coat protein - protein 5 domain protein [Clostridia bacterium]|nr:P22 coat protein - protein 5 domain protein [Clostridia bacterium]